MSVYLNYLKYYSGTNLKLKVIFTRGS